MFCLKLIENDHICPSGEVASSQPVTIWRSCTTLTLACSIARKNNQICPSGLVGNAGSIS